MTVVSTRQTIYQEHTSPPLGMEDYNEDSYLEDIKEGPILFHALVVTDYFLIIL